MRDKINERSGLGLDQDLLKRREDSFLFENFSELGLISPVCNQLFHESTIQGSLRIIHDFHDLKTYLCFTAFGIFPKENIFTKSKCSPTIY